MKRATKFDIVVICLLLVAGGSTFFLSNSSGPKRLKLITANSSEYLSFSDRLYHLKDTHNTDVLVEVKDGKARISHSSCLGKICIRTGWINRCGESAVCLPNKTAIQIECEGSDIDAISQ